MKEDESQEMREKPVTRKTSTIKHSEETLNLAEQEKTSASTGSNSTKIYALRNASVSSNRNHLIDVNPYNAEWINRTRVELVGLVD